MRQVDSQEGHVKNKVRLPAAVHTQGLGYVRTLSQCEEKHVFQKKNNGMEPFKAAHCIGCADMLLA